MTTKFIALDSETTGLVPGQDRIIEIAAVVFDPATGQPTGESFHRDLDPEQEIPAEAVAIHGKTWDMLKGNPRFSDIALELVDFVKDANVVIHNANFDLRHLQAEFEKLNRPSLQSVVAEVTDTLKLARKFCKVSANDLDSLCAAYGVASAPRALHSALDDCNRVAAVFPHIAKEAQQRIAQLDAILPVPFGAPMPGSLIETAQRALAIDELIGFLTKEKNRYTDEVKNLVGGLDYVDDYLEIKFSNTTKTDWAKITEEHLASVDLKPYQKKSPRMTIKSR